MSWFAYAAVFVLFLLSHSIPTRPSVKARIILKIGPRAFTTLYSILSLAMLLLLIRAASWPDPILLWPQSPLTVNMTRIGMIAVCLLLALSIGRPNPFSFGGSRNAEFDPARPGIVRLHRHPLLLGLTLWAGLHLLPNGDLAHVLLFGTLGGFALLGMRLIDRRKQHVLGRENWTRLLRQARHTALHDMFQAGDLLRILYGLLAYGLLIASHTHFAGISVL